VLSMGNRDVVDYRVGDMTATPWPDASFAAISSISVIEHGVPLDRLARELGRLLQPRGVFVFSADYWPDEIRVEGTEAFGLPWRILSRADILDFIGLAAREGLHPLADPSEALRAIDERPVEWHGYRYTFMYGALERR